MAITLKNRKQRERKIKFGDKTYPNDRPYEMGLIKGRCYQLAKDYINDEDEDYPAAQVLKRYMFLGRFDKFMHAYMTIKAIIFINDYDDPAKPIVTKIYVHPIKPKEKSKLWFKEVDCVQPNNIALGMLASRKNGKAQLPLELWQLVKKAAKAIPRKPRLSLSNRRTGRRLSPASRNYFFKEPFTGHISDDSSSSEDAPDSPIIPSPSSSSKSSSSPKSSKKSSGGHNKTRKGKRSS